MEQILATNLQYLKACHPDLSAQLDHMTQEAMDIELCQGKDVTLKVQGRQLTSRHDRLGQAQLAINTLNLNQPIFIYGFGLGDELRVLLTKPQAQRITVFILNPWLFAQLLAMDNDLQAILTARQIHLELAQQNTSLHDNAIIITPELYIDQSYLNRLKNTLILSLDETYAQANFEATIGKLLNESILEDKEQLLKEQVLTINQLPQVTKALVVGAGPSLELQIEQLKQLQQQGYEIFTVDTASILLEKHAITAQHIASVDANIKYHIKDKLFNYPAYAASSLYFGPALGSSVYTKFSGKRYLMITDRLQKLIPHSFDKHDYLKIDAHGSVLLYALQLALLSGAKEIKFLGCDFAYLDNQTHALTDVKNLTGGDSKIKVLCNDGRQQKTQHNFLVYRQYVEEVIAQHPQISFINISKTGAIIEGCRQ